MQIVAKLTGNEIKIKNHFCKDCEWNEESLLEGGKCNFTVKPLRKNHITGKIEYTCFRSCDKNKNYRCSDFKLRGN
jgi:RNase P subunit RPR2